MNPLRSFLHWISAKIEASLASDELDLDCPHEPVGACQECKDDAILYRAS